MKAPLAPPLWLVIALAAIALLFVSAPDPAPASETISETIKVLVLDGDFKEVPDEQEQLSRLDSVDGELLIGYRRYTGTIEVWLGKNGLYLISELPIETYVEGVVMSEIFEDWAMEAVKAQAVIARTYALAHKAVNTGGIFHLTSSTIHQMFRGDVSSKRISHAVQSTRGQVVVYKGQPIEALYHSTSGGMTASSQEVFGNSLPYLVPVSSDSSRSPYNMWSRKIPLAEIAAALSVPGLIGLKVVSLTSSGRVDELLVTTTGPTSKTIKAVELRKALVDYSRLPSTMFKIKPNKGSVVFEGSGFGHGVGLDQWGALEMAKQGASYRGILSHYYPGTDISVFKPSVEPAPSGDTIKQ